MKVALAPALAAATVAVASAVAAAVLPPAVVLAAAVVAAAADELSCVIGSGTVLHRNIRPDTPSSQAAEPDPTSAAIMGVNSLHTYMYVVMPHSSFSSLECADRCGGLSCDL